MFGAKKILNRKSNKKSEYVQKKAHCEWANGLDLTADQSSAESSQLNSCAREQGERPGRSFAGFIWYTYTS